MKPSSCIKWGILGLGNHAQKVMIPAFAQARGAKLFAAATRNAKAQKNLKTLHSGVTFYSTYDALLNDTSIDALYIGLPNHLHCEWTVKALQSGKHVLCDKPMALSHAQAALIRQTAEDSGKRMLEGFMYRFHPQHQKVRELVSGGAIGSIRLFESHFHYLLEKQDNIRLKPECGGGGLNDVGCYGIDCARFLLEKQPTRVSAAWAVNSDFGVDESASFQLCYEDGSAAHITCGCMLGRANFYALYGTKGVLRAPDAYHVPRTKNTRIEIELCQGGKKTIQIAPCNQFVKEIEEFSRWIIGEEVDESLFSDGVDNARVLEATRDAAENKKMVEIS